MDGYPLTELRMVIGWMLLFVLSKERESVRPPFPFADLALNPDSVDPVGVDRPQKTRLRRLEEVVGLSAVHV